MIFLRDLLDICMVGIYQKRFVEYVGYKRIERKLVKTDELLEQIRKSREDQEETWIKSNLIRLGASA